MNVRIVEEYLTKEVLAEIEKIDDTFYVNDITGLQWYTNRYTPHHKGYLLLDGHELAGYIIAVPIKKELYDKFYNGELTNDVEISPELFVESSDYYYLSSCVLKEDYRGKGYGTGLLQRAVDDNSKNYIAISVSVGGYNLLSKYMNCKQKINDKVCVFEKRAKDASVKV